MQFSHSADDGLACLRIGLDGEGRILLRQFSEGDSELVKILLGLGLDGDTDNGIGEFHGFQGKFVALVADGVPRAEVLESYCGADVSGLHEIDGILVVGVHLIEPGHALFLARTGVDHVRTGVEVT